MNIISSLIIRIIVIFLTLYPFAYLLVTCVINNLIYMNYDSLYFDYGSLFSMTLVNIKPKSIITKNSLINNLNKFFERKIIAKLSANDTFKMLIKALINDNTSNNSIQLSKTNKYISLTPMLFVRNNSNDIFSVKQEAVAGLDKSAKLYTEALLFSELLIDWLVIDKLTFKNNEDRNPWSINSHTIDNFAFPVTVDYNKYAHNIQNLNVGKISYTDLFGFQNANKMEFSVSLIVDNKYITVYLVKFFIDSAPGISGKKYIEFTDILNKATGLITRKFSSGKVLTSNNFKIFDINSLCKHWDLGTLLVNLTKLVALFLIIYIIFVDYSLFLHSLALPAFIKSTGSKTESFHSKKIMLKNDLNKKSLRDNLYVFLHRNQNQYLNLIIKVRTADKYKVRLLSLTKSVYIDLHNIEEINNYKNYVLAQFENKLENYKSLRFTGLFFEYNILTKDSYDLNKDKNPWIPAKVNLKEFDFPLSVNYSDLAKVTQTSPTGIYYSDCHGFKDAQLSKFYVNNILDISDRAIYLVKLTMKGNDYVFNDILNKETGEIKRIFSSAIEENSNIFKLEDLSLKNNIAPLKTFEMRKEELQNNWKDPVFYACTLDCETYLDANSTQHLMSIAIFDGRKEYFFFIKDYNSEFEMVKEVLLTLLKYNNYNIYIHNGAKFDLFFLLKHFVALTDELNLYFNPIYKDGEFIDLRIDKIINKDKCISISIKDSYKILLCSLAKLAKVFDLESPKGTFPFDFAKPANFNYIGITPEYKFYAFDGKSLISKDEHNALIKNNWSFRNELMKYNINDCIILFKILNKFFKLIIDKFEIDMKYNPTLSSLAFSIYRVGFIPDSLKSINVTNITNKNNEEFVRFSLDSKIDVLSNNIDSFIREGYFGGHVDAYIPHFDNSLPQWKDQILHHYDVVSLYPSVMLNSNIPYKVINHYTGNLLENRPDLFELWTGFHRVKVTCPHDLINPILPYRSQSGVVIYPTGTWSGVYFSEEIKNAMKFGYKFEFLEGYIFLSSTEIFSQYINTLFQMKQNSEKGSPMYLISKTLQNSLFGRFGIHQELPNYQILNNQDIKTYLSKFPLKKEQDKISLTNDYSLINFEGENTTPEANVAVSASITAFSRIVMSQVKNDPDHLLFYSDTDSAFTNSPLPENLVGNNLGQFALENKFIKFIALGPKMYAGITTEGKEIVKIKGLSKDNLPSYKDLETLLLSGKSLMTENKKLFKDLGLGQITLKNLSYLIKPTSNKRDFLYSGNTIIGTKNKIVKD